MKASRKTPLEVDWSKSDSQIACEMGWSIFATSKKRVFHAPDQFKSRGLAGKVVRLTGEAYIGLLMVNPLAEWWSGLCESEGGDFLVINVANRGLSTFLKDHWVACK